jgi:hydroxymethylbilane synthase
MHGIILAAAGLERLALLKSHHTLLSPAEMLPAMNQGILAAQFVAPEVGAICYQIAHSDTQSAFLTERHCSEQLGADCRSALGIFATTTPNQISLEVAIFSPDGTQVLRAARHAPRGEEEKLADKLANDLLMQGASALLAIGTPGKTKP